MKKTIKATLLLFSLVMMFSANVSAGTTISKPKKSDPNASIDRRGITTYYNSNLQKWKDINGPKPLYKYQAKKDIKYYKPIFYLSSIWVPNNKKNIEVVIGTSYEESVTHVVSAEIGVSTTKEKVNLATKVSSSYSSTCKYSSSYSTKYTFVMKNYSTKYKYRPAAFGDIYAYWVKRTHRITGKVVHLGDCYTFNSKKGCDLRMAVK